jgi:hypothetical protein
MPNYRLTKTPRSAVGARALAKTERMTCMLWVLNCRHQDRDGKQQSNRSAGSRPRLDDDASIQARCALRQVTQTAADGRRGGIEAAAVIRYANFDEEPAAVC